MRDIYAVLCIMRCYVGWRTERIKFIVSPNTLQRNENLKKQKTKATAERKIMDLIKIESTKCSPEK